MTAAPPPPTWSAPSEPRPEFVAACFTAPGRRVIWDDNPKPITFRCVDGAGRVVLSEVGPDPLVIPLPPHHELIGPRR